MSHTHRFTPGTLEERIAGLEKYLEELQLHRDSRRGTEGARGEQGIPGPVGQAGPPGKDADVREVVETAKRAIQEEFNRPSVRRVVEEAKQAIQEEYGTAERVLREVVLHELKSSGVIDEEGKAILIPGPVGAPSTVAGAKGDPGIDGKSIVGPAGRDAKIAIGHVTAGEKASVAVREENGIQFLDFALPRGERGPAGESIRGEKGAKGNPGQSIEGCQGIPGEGLSRQEVIDLVLDMKRRKTI
jgi:hypothetical protein